jgi:predicted ferric reductase
MRPIFLAVRAIGAEFAHRIYLAVTLFVGLLSIAVLGGTLWLTTLNAWWWALFAVVGIWTLIAVVGLIAARHIIMALAPTTTKEQRAATKAFVSKLQRLSEVAGTPKPFLLLRIVRDMIKPSQHGFIGSLGEAASLKYNFVALIRTFE